MAAVDGAIVRYVYRGEEGEVIPREATHVVTVANITFVRRNAFYEHPNIIEVICHEDVEKIEKIAFLNCPRLRRVIMPGVTIVEVMAFDRCPALTDVECIKLETIKDDAFNECTSLRSIHLPSARIVKECAFSYCKILKDVKFGKKLERIEKGAFDGCTSLERITFPFKDGMITDDDIFNECVALRQVDLVEGTLHDTIAALQLEEWREDISAEIDSINQILPNLDAGGWDDDLYDNVPGEQARAIRMWIRSVLRKIVHYQAEHRRVLDKAAAILQCVLPQDIMTNNVLPFLDLPPQTFGGDDNDDQEEEDGGSDG